MCWRCDMQGDRGQPCPQVEAEIEAAEDLWNDGALDGCRGKPAASQDPDYLEGHQHGAELRKVQVQMPERPEGYYHQNLKGE